MTNVEMPAEPKRAILCYMDVERLLYRQGGKLLLSRKIENNTWLERCPTGIQLRLHKTPIITWHRDNTLTLRTDGWFTMTTRERMNRFLPDHGDGRVLWVQPFDSYWHIGTRYAKDEQYRYAMPGNAPEGFVPFEEDMNLDMITCTMISGDKDLTEDKAYNATFERLLTAWLRSWDKLEEAVGLPDERDPAFRTHLEACLRNKKIPAGFLSQVANDLGFYNVNQVVNMWSHNRRIAKQQVRKWFRAKMLRGSRSRGRAIRTREFDDEG